MNSGTNSNKEIDMKTFEGKVLQGRYVLSKFIGQGNFGAIYKSEQQFLGVPVRRVALKLSKSTNVNITTAKDIFADAFRLAEVMDELIDAEARKYLVHVYDIGILSEMDKRMLIVMEYVDGTDLAEEFESLKRIPANMLLKWAKQICHAIKELHNMSVLHRDLKPDNIRIGIDRNVRILDFGLAAKLIKHGYVPGVAGTTTYMAPETTQGVSYPASDVYSIGIILYEGLTGTHPFKHLVPPFDQPEALYNDWLYEQKKTAKPTRPSILNNTVEPHLDDIIMRCLKFKYTDRYINAGELLKDLIDSKKPDPPDIIAFKKGEELVRLGDMDNAIRKFKQGLSCKSSSNETLFELNHNTGKVLMKLERYEEASTSLVNAWELTKNSAILRTKMERVKLLKLLVEAFNKIGNSFQASKYERLIDKELKTK